MKVVNSKTSIRKELFGEKMFFKKCSCRVIRKGDENFWKKCE